MHLLFILGVLQYYIGIMSYQISFGNLQDVSRITTINQKFLLKIQSYNHSQLNSPPIEVAHNSWDYEYAILASQKQIIKFYLCSMAYQQFMKVVAVGKLDLREQVALHGGARSFQTRIILDAGWNNQVLLHLRCQYRDERVSRNNGLRQTRLPKKKVSSKRPEDYERKKIFKPETIKQPSNQMFYKGPCQSRNFFSFLDPIYKGQSFNFVEPSKK